MLAGYGIKLWPIVQNISQLRELYPQNWETFLGNAGIWTVFAMNDAETAKYLGERLGQRLLRRKVRSRDGDQWEPAGNASLRDALQLRQDTSRESGTMAAFTESGEAFLLTRTNYDALFRRDQYSPDPFEPGRMAVRSRIARLFALLRQAANERNADAARKAGAARQGAEPKEPVPAAAERSLQGTAGHEEIGVTRAERGAGS